ncbi:MAG: heavy metal translocating P-type ATPase [Magnetococcales bacterium]|nr:heavy metal translocating P-type ATPase [Magnetococcales bacterium]
MNRVQIVHELPNRLRFRLATPAGTTLDCDTLQAYLESRPGVTSVRINHPAQSIIVQHDGRHGMRTALTTALTRRPPSHPGERGVATGRVCQNLSGGLTPVISGLVLLATPLLPKRLQAAVTWASLSQTLFTGLQTLIFRGIKVEVLDALAVGLSAWRGEYVTANTTQFMLHLGEYLQNSTERKSEDLVKNLLLPIPTDAWVEREGTLVQVPVNEITMGDLVEVGVGELIPVDGEVVEGMARVNQASLTGETVPVKKEMGDGAISGTVVEEGRIRIRAVRVGDHTVIARIGHFIEDSLKNESTTQRLAANLADKRVFFTFAMGAMVFAMTRDLRRMASTFLVDFACGIKISTPVAFKSAMYQGGTMGILFKGGQAIENIALADTFAFDKTGTLTSGRLEVVEVRLFHPGCTEDRLLALVASLEEHSTHPVASAIVQEANQRSLPHMQHGVVDFIVAHGLQSSMDGKTILVGSRHFLEEDEGISFAAHGEEINALMERGYLVLLAARDREPLGIIALRDHLREDTVAVLKELRQLGVKQLIMLTGDHRIKARQLGAELGMDAVHHELIPGEKMSIINQLKQDGHRVALVGDGINDAPALATADVGIAMPRGAELTRNTADIVLMRDQLYGIVEARRLAMRTMELVRTNFKIAVGVNGAIMAGSAMGRFNPVATSILHNGTTLAILVNSLAGTRMTEEHGRDVMQRMQNLRKMLVD